MNPQVWCVFLIVFFFFFCLIGRAGNIKRWLHAVELAVVDWTITIKYQPPSSAHDLHQFSLLAFPFFSSHPFLVSVSSSWSHFLLTTPQKPPVLPCNEDILPVGRLMVDRERYLTNPKPPDSSGNFTQNLSFFHWKESPFTV